MSIDRLTVFVCLNVSSITRVLMSIAGCMVITMSGMAVKEGAHNENIDNALTSFACSVYDIRTAQRRHSLGNVFAHDKKTAQTICRHLLKTQIYADAKKAYGKGVFGKFSVVAVPQETISRGN